MKDTKLKQKKLTPHRSRIKTVSVGYFNPASSPDLPACPPVPGPEKWSFLPPPPDHAFLPSASEPLGLRYVNLRDKSAGPPLAARPSYYPEYIDKSDNTLGGDLNYRQLQNDAGGVNPANTSLAGAFLRDLATPPYVPRCSGVFLTGSCSGGHRHLKAVVCGKEWCRECGMNNSTAHRRRIERWKRKYETFTSVGYLVITVPRELRNEFKDREVLQDFRRYIRRKLQRTDLSGRSYTVETPYRYTTKAGKVRSGVRRKEVGYTAGFIRYHYAGDCPACKGKGCSSCAHTGAGREYKPHLNVLLPEKWSSKDKLEQFKTDVALWFKKRFSLEKMPEKNVYYQYHRGPEEKAHKLRYVTRSTWRFYSPEIADLLHGFHTAASWGRFPPDVSMNLTEAGERGVCLHCLQNTGKVHKIKWNTKLTREEAEKVICSYRHHENGYYTAHNDMDLLLKE